MIEMAAHLMILNPQINNGVSINVETIIRTEASYGELSNQLVSYTDVPAVWAELGHREKETADGRELMELGEVLINSFDYGPYPPQDTYFVYNGNRFKVLESLDKTRMTGMTLYEVGRVIT